MDSTSCDTRSLSTGLRFLSRKGLSLIWLNRTVLVIGLLSLRYGPYVYRGCEHGVPLRLEFRLVQQVSHSRRHCGLYGATSTFSCLIHAGNLQLGERCLNRHRPHFGLLWHSTIIL